MDIEILLFYQGIRQALGPVVEKAFAVFSDLITNPALYVVFAAIYWCIDKKFGRYVILSIVSGVAVNQLIKNTVCAYRPWIRDSRIIPAEAAVEEATGYSFPSGHTMQGTTQCVSIARTFKNKRWVVILCIVIALLIGISRNYLGVHTPQDVIVAWILGTLIALGCGRLNDWIDQNKNNDVKLMVFGLIAAAVYLAYITFKSYPMDYVDGVLLVDPQEMMNDCYSSAGVMVGFVVGLVIERHFINFEVAGTKLQKFLRFALGMVMMLVVYVGCKHPIYNLLGGHWGRFVLYSSLFVIGFIICPLIFKACHGKIGVKKSE